MSSTESNAVNIDQSVCQSSLAIAKDMIKSESCDSLSNVSNKSIFESNPLFLSNESNGIQLNDKMVANKPNPTEDGEEVIRCICGIVREEGEMIQCDKCEVRLISYDFNYY